MTARVGGKLDREKRTIAAMIGLYCRDHHGSSPREGRGGDGALCEACHELKSYAERRLERCPFEDEKPPCADCPIHCYQRERRDQIRAVMRHAGPRLFLRHPILTLRHTLDGYRPIPDHPKRRSGGGKS